MKKKSREKIEGRRLAEDSYRILDANLNRSKEGLRVCEDICRFHLKDETLTKKCGGLRHALTSVARQSRLCAFKLFQNRSVTGDFGRKFCGGPKRSSFKSVFMANSQRVKEALRVLEEFSKLFDPAAAAKFQRLRFKFYELEKEAVERFPALLDSR